MLSPLVGGGSDNRGIGNGKYGYTGKGVDGVSQTMKKVPGVGSGSYDAHESEFVFDANATQAIGPQLLSDVMDAARSGQVDTNKIREAIGQQSKPQMYTGGEVKVRKESRTGKINPIGAVNITPVKNNIPTSLPMNEVGKARVANKVPTSRTGKISQVDVPTAEEIAASKKNQGTDYQAIGQEAIDKYRGVMSGDDQFYQTQRDRLAQDLGGAGAAATAAMQQRGAASGMTEEGIGTMTSVRQRDVEAGTGAAMTDMALGQQEMAIGAARDLTQASQWGQGFEENKRQWEQGFEENKRQWQENMDFMKQKYGDQEGARMANDAASGMGWESFKEKYPNATKDDWQRMQTGWQQTTAANEIGLESAQITLDTMKQNTYGARLMDEVDKRITTDPNFVRSGAWKDDQQILNNLAQYWENSGNEEAFDPSNPEHMAWAESQMKAFSISQVDAGINEMKNSEWYQGLSAEEQAQYETEVFPAIAQLSAMDGIQPKFTEDGLELYGPDGELIYPPNRVKEEKEKEEKEERYGGVEVPEDIEIGETFEYGGDLYEYQAGDNIAKVEYESGIDQPFGAEADKLVEKFGYDSDAGKEILNDRADALASGESADWDKIDGPDDPLYKKLLNHPSITTGKGNKETVEVKGLNNDYHSFSNLESAEKSGALIKFDGRIVRVTGSDAPEDLGVNNKAYYLVDVATGETRTERAPENLPSEGVWSGGGGDRFKEFTKIDNPDNGTITQRMAVPA